MAAVASASQGGQKRRKRDLRPLGLALVVLGTAGVGLLVMQLPSQEEYQPAKARIEMSTDGLNSEMPALFPPLAEGESMADLVDLQARTYLGDTRQLLDAGRYQDAFDYLNQTRAEVKHRPEAFMLMGEALMGRKEFELARDFFNAAIDRDLLMADAYYGFARAAEALGDLEQAVGGMRSYLHLQNDPDPYRLKVAQARSAIWEWDSRLGRGAWGPTRGIPPGFTAAELKRDGKGAGTKIPIPGTEDENGFMQYEIKYSDKIRMFER